MRVKILFYTICILVFMVLQSTLLDYIRIYDVIPNLLIVLTILAALLGGNSEGAVVGFFSGLVLDIMFGKLLGFYALLGMYLGIAVGSVNRRLYKDNLLVIIFFTLVFSIAYETTVYILNTIMSGNMDLIYPFTRIILPEAVYNCAAAILLYPLFARVNGRMEEARKSARKY